MATPSEQKALAFLALVVLLGAAVRVVRGGSTGSATATPAERHALASQAFSASSASAQARRSGSARSKRMAPRRRGGGVEFDTTGATFGVELTPTGFPPPLPRIDIGATGSLGVPTGALVDLDVAGTAKLERLPGVGPALARRIVASRDSLGPFGALPALGRVKGVGPGTLRRLAPLVTFSAQARR